MPVFRLFNSVHLSSMIQFCRQLVQLDVSRQQVPDGCSRNRASTLTDMSVLVLGTMSRGAAVSVSGPMGRTVTYTQVEVVNDTFTW